MHYLEKFAAVLVLYSSVVPSKRVYLSCDASVFLTLLDAGDRANYYSHSIKSLRINALCAIILKMSIDRLGQLLTKLNRIRLICDRKIGKDMGDAIALLNCERNAMDAEQAR